MFSFEFPKVSAMAVLYPSMVEGHLLRTLIADITYSRIPEVHLFFCAPSLEDCPLGRVDDPS